VPFDVVAAAVDWKAKKADCVLDPSYRLRWNDRRRQNDSPLEWSGVPIENAIPTIPVCSVDKAKG
jgi:hypothetical protein